MEQVELFREGNAAADAIRPFFSYFGGKWRLAPKYPPPEHDIIVEPFAGSAGYATRYPDHEVVLVERSAQVAALWRWLIRVSVDELMGLPIDTSATGLSDEARLLIGFWCLRGRTSARSISSWLKHQWTPQLSSWTRATRSRIAGQLGHIRHWRVIEGDYTAAPDVRATWFIDPPYVGSAHYLARVDDYEALGYWARRRRGLAIVCERSGATWLPFIPFRTVQNLSGRSYDEVVWHQSNESRSP